MRSKTPIGMMCVSAAFSLTASAATAAVPAWQRWLTHVPAGGVDWRDATFAEAVDWLGDRDRTGAPTHMNIVLDLAALEIAGVDEDSDVRLTLRNVPLARVLQLLLGQLAPDDRLAYVVDENVLRITTRDRLDREMLVRTYDVSSILRSVPDFTGPAIRMEMAGYSGGSSRGTSTTVNGATLDDPGEDTAADRAQRLADLVAAIETAVEPASWASRGGEGTIAAVGPTLVVRNSAANHEIIAGLLSQLSK